MKWTLIWTRPALKDMKKLEPVLARRLREAMIDLAETGTIHGVHLISALELSKEVGPPQ